MTEKDLFNQIREIIIETKAEKVLLQLQDIQLESDLLGFPIAMDSIDFVWMIIGIEERFGIIAEDEDLLPDSIRTVADVIEMVKQRLSDSAEESDSWRS